MPTRACAMAPGDGLPSYAAAEHIPHMTGLAYVPRIDAVRHIRQHVLWIRFSDGTDGELDFSGNFHGSMFERLRDPAEFAHVRVACGALVWPNGADWAPEPLYDLLRAGLQLGRQPNDAAKDADAGYIAGMPEISRFFGMVIRMLANDHAPPHFHAHYGDFEVTVDIRDGVVTGRFPARALRLVLEWRDEHVTELMENWNRLRAGEPPEPIEPLT